MTTVAKKTRNSGGSVETVHSTSCPSHEGKRCRCQPLYRARIMVNGKRANKSSRVRREVDRWLVDMQEAKDGGTFHIDERTVASAVADTLRLMEEGKVLNRNKQKYGLNAIQKYRSSWERHLAKHLGPIKVQKLTREQVQDAYDNVRLEWTPGTAKDSLKALQVTFRVLLRQDRVKKNVTQGLELERVKYKRRPQPTWDEAEKLIAVLAHPKPKHQGGGAPRDFHPSYDQALWGCALYAGLTQSELAALTLDSVDLKAGFITVAEGFDHRNRIIKDVKGGAGSPRERNVPIRQELRALLQEHLSHRGIQPGFLFPRYDGGPFTNSAVRKRAWTTWEFHGLQPYGIHAFRHTFVTRLITSGANTKLVSMVAGHSHTQTTLDIYTEITDEDVKGAVEQMFKASGS